MQDLGLSGRMILEQIKINGMERCGLDSSG
jgi:hypothetical protein